MKPLAGKQTKTHLLTALFLLSLFRCDLACAQDNVIPLEPEGNTTTVASETPAETPSENIPTISPEAIRDETASSDSEGEPNSGGVRQPEENLLAKHPWLQELYVWNESFNLSKESIQANTSGAYCVGNGRTFALIGLANPLWSWSNIYGDSYQEPDLGQMRMTVSQSGVDLKLAHQQIGWVKRSGVVRVRAQDDNLSAETYDFAPFINDSPSRNPSVLVRLVRLANTSNAVQTGLELRLKVLTAWNVKVKRKSDKGDLLLEQKPTKVKRRTYWRLGAFEAKNAKSEEKSLRYKVPAIPPGGETWMAFFLSSADSPEENASQTEKIRSIGPLNLLDETRAYFQKWFQNGSEFAGNSKIRDLFEIESIIFKSQQSHSGGFSPLIGYSYTWIRDNNGPIRWFLKTGHVEEARRAMDFFYGLASSMGSLPNSVRVDYPLSYRLSNLSNIHVEHAETPNWIILQHWWYYLATGDLKLIRERWPYLKQCLKGQVREEGKFFFHRDETYLWCLESRTFDHVPFPNYFLSTYAFATDSSFDFTAASDCMAYLGSQLAKESSFVSFYPDINIIQKEADKVRAKAEESYWDEEEGYWAPAQSFLGPLYHSPFANILINPLWCGYARNDLDPLGGTKGTFEKAVQALTRGYEILGRDDGFWKTTPTVENFVGMNPGQLLFSLCKAKLPWAAKAYQTIFKAATPSGEFAEMYDGEYRPWNPPLWGVGTSGRVRPWEGGLDTESLLEFITGFTPDAGKKRVVFAPHLPEGEKQFSALRLPVGESEVSLFMDRVNGKEWKMTVHLDKGPSIETVVDLWPVKNLLEGISLENQGVIWDKNIVDSKNHEAIFHFQLEESRDRSVTIVEGASLPDKEINPPVPQEFDPKPYSTQGDDFLLMTSPSAVLNKKKHVPPLQYLAIGRSELKFLRRLSPSVGVLDLDLPISTSDIIKGLVDAAGNTRTKMAVWGYGAFSPGTHDFKPVSYWNGPKLGEAVKIYLKNGGIVFLGPSYLDREVVPDWLVSLTGEGWEMTDNDGEAIAVGKSSKGPSLKVLDEVDVGNEKSEQAHQIKMDGELYQDKLLLPEGPTGTKPIEDDGRGFKGFYQFSVKTEPGFDHRLWVRVNTGRNIKGMVLQVQSEGRWVATGVRTKRVNGPQRFLTFYYPISLNLITSQQTVCRLVAKGGVEVNAYHLWMYRDQPEKVQTLASLLGFKPGDILGEVTHGLSTKGGGWKAPVALSQHPEEAAVLIQKVGKGYLVRSELSLEDSMPLLNTFLNNHSVDLLSQFWAENSK